MAPGLLWDYGTEIASIKILKTIVDSGIGFDIIGSCTTYHKIKSTE